MSPRDASTDVRNVREQPLIRAIAEELARLLGGRASAHMRAARKLLADSLVALADLPSPRRRRAAHDAA